MVNPTARFHLLLLLLLLIATQTCRIYRFSEAKVHIPDELDDVVDDEEDEAWREWGKPKKQPEFDPPPTDFTKMGLQEMQDEMMKRQQGPVFGSSSSDPALPVRYGVLVLAELLLFSFGTKLFGEIAPGTSSVSQLKNGLIWRIGLNLYSSGFTSTTLTSDYSISYIAVASVKALRITSGLLIYLLQETVSEIAMKWTKVARTGAIEAKFSGVDVSTIMFTMQKGQDALELKEFLLSQSEAYEIKIGDQLFRRPGDPSFEEVFEKLQAEKNKGYDASERHHEL
ncbi:UNVERIFIED_CONTAM: hypothetical protein Slati_0369400 [Sesamum latifolium]|uniref:Uncharacterized protein n=1 Tax=Sesamum latifolium TaxID=2727402 RepID=A0AAW2YGJ5_9LAMI